ncbi:penicillin-binding protein [Lactococcus termiticola]|uniref:Cell division protein FtsI / penicillin-binding protein 2 n=1 Tax=Lactococcus termiticola TaxID=2169526 RepID=A0A2R5HJB7_9LACT|nr:penicillin-binding protein [Lactococcus termiticola]GBG96301.1 cell division protein FtsI / penicillin-binding protein 2 [Lactococcus termiticola]
MIKFLSRLFGTPHRLIQKKAQKSQLTPESNRKRVGKIVFLLSIVLFTVFIFRFVWLITVNRVGGVDLAKMAKENYSTTVTVNAKRGTIYDRNGTPIAIDSSTYTIYAVIDKTQTDANGNPQYVVPDKYDEVANFLNKELNIDKDYAISQLKQKKSQVQFGTQGMKISPSRMTQIEKDAENQKIVGLGFSAQLARSYPQGNFASQFVGFASPQNTNSGGTVLVGSSGLENAYNSVLSGENGEINYQKDPFGRPLPGSTKTIKQTENGKDVYTTIDGPIQSNLENLLDNAAKVSGGQQLSATLMDAHTGEILATSQRPTINANNQNTASKQEYFTWSNLLYQSQFEPGSTMKTFLLASALDSNHVNLNQSFTRTLKVYDVDINDWDWNEYGEFRLPTSVTAAQGFEMSSNVVMSKIEMQMGNSTWNQYLKRLKFGVPTRFGLGGEGFGSLPSSNPVSQIQSAFGQGISATPIQLLRGWTSFANGGEMLEPHVVNKIYDSDNKTAISTSPEVIGKPFSSKSVDTVRDLMVGVNTDPNYGTAYLTKDDAGHSPGPLFLVNGNPMAVKTGTAQIAAPNGGYMTGPQDNMYSAVAMYPPKNPDFIFYMNIKIPTSDWFLGYISDVANNVVAQAEARKSQIEATDTTNYTAGKVTIADYKGKGPGSTSDKLRQELLNPVVIGTGDKVTEQSIASGEEVSANTKILLLTNGDPTMPDTYKWKKDQVEQLAKWYNLKITYKGDGDTVSGQSVSAGQDIKRGQSITINMN